MTTGPGVGPLSTSGISSHSSPDTPGIKKERNSRKQCPYCHKGELLLSTSDQIFLPDCSDFHEMSLKRHIKDVHFKNQNTYVICPQCCKQYASQNSLYSHLNRVISCHLGFISTSSLLGAWCQERRHTTSDGRNCWIGQRRQQPQ